MFTGSLLGYLTASAPLEVLLSEERRFQLLDPDVQHRSEAARLSGQRGKGRERMGRMGEDSWDGPERLYHKMMRTHTSHHLLIHMPTRWSGPSFGP